MSTLNESLSNLGERQQALLRELRREQGGLTVDELIARLQVTRTAVNQHVKSLEDKGYIARGSLRGTTGRPGRTHVLTSKGLELFPRQYSWFSALLFSKIQQDIGPEKLMSALRDIASGVAEQLKTRFAGKSLEGRVDEIVTVMGELGYEAHRVESHSAFPIIEANNCVYHSLAREHPVVCEFDVQLLQDLSGAVVEQEECMVRGGRCCRFRFK